MKINWFKIEINEIIDSLFHLIDVGSALRYSDFLIYLKQGEDCKDCGEMFMFCSCNNCKECDFAYCLCNLELTKIRKIIELWIIYNLSKKSINNLLSKLILLNLSDEGRFEKENLLIKKIIKGLKNI